MVSRPPKGRGARLYLCQTWHMPLTGFPGGLLASPGLSHFRLEVEILLTKVVSSHGLRLHALAYCCRSWGTRHEARIGDRPGTSADTVSDFFLGFLCWRMSGSGCWDEDPCQSSYLR